MKRISIKVDCDCDLLFWHLVPSININLHSHEIEFEWLCIGFYISKIKQNKYEKEISHGLYMSFCEQGEEDMTPKGLLGQCKHFKREQTTN